MKWTDFFVVENISPETTKQSYSQQNLMRIVLNLDSCSCLIEHEIKIFLFSSWNMRMSDRNSRSRLESQNRLLVRHWLHHHYHCHHHYDQHHQHCKEKRFDMTGVSGNILLCLVIIRKRLYRQDSFRWWSPLSWGCWQWWWWRWWIWQWLSTTGQQHLMVMMRKMTLSSNYNGVFFTPQSMIDSVQKETYLTL